MCDYMWGEVYYLVFSFTHKTLFALTIENFFAKHFVKTFVHAMVCIVSVVIVSSSLDLDIFNYLYGLHNHCRFVYPP